MISGARVSHARKYAVFGRGTLAGESYSRSTARPADDRSEREFVNKFGVFYDVLSFSLPLSLCLS